MFLKDITHYDGTLLNRRFAYEYFRKDTLRSGNIISFIGSATVTDHLVDLEDALEKDFIYSDKMIHFLTEIPDIDLFGGVAFQRLFNAAIANVLHQYIKLPIEMKGDDLIVHGEHSQGGVVQLKGKASVSIATMRNGAVLSHTGINIEAGKKAPAFAFSTKLTDEQALEFIKNVEHAFYEMTDNIFLATTKTI
jgi:hypothetical protein